MTVTDHIPRRGYQAIGLGFWQAWQMVVLCTDAVAPDGVVSSSLKTIVIMATTLGYILVMGINRIVPSLLRADSSLVAAGLTMSLGTFVMLFVPQLEDPVLQTSALVVGLAGMSLGNAMLLMMWGELWSELATGRVGQHLYWSYAFAFVLYFLSEALPTAVDGLFACTFPLLSCAILKTCENEPRRRPLQHALCWDDVPTLRILLFVFVLSVIWGLTQRTVPAFATGGSGGFSFMYSMAVAGLAIVAFVAWLALSAPESEAIALYQPVVPAMAIGLALLVLLPTDWAFLGNGLLTMGIYCLDMFIMLVATDLAFRTRKSTVAVFGTGIVASRLGTLAGTLVGAQVGTVDASFVNSLTVGSLCAAALVGMLAFSKADLLKLYEAPQAPRKAAVPAAPTGRALGEPAEAPGHAATAPAPDGAPEGGLEASREAAARREAEPASGPFPSAAPAASATRGMQAVPVPSSAAAAVEAEPADEASRPAPTAAPSPEEPFVSPLSRRCALVAQKAGLTARETEVLELLVRGRTVQDVCDELSIAQGTAKHHVSNIYRKLGVGDRRSLYDIVEREGSPL